MIPQLAQALDRRGTYAVVVGGQFRAGSNVLERGQAARVATEAFEEHGDEGLAATLLAFVDGVAAERSGSADSGSEETSLWPILAVVGAGGFGFVLLRRRRRARREREALATGKTVAQEDLLALADDIRALDLDVEMPDVDREAKEHYGRSVEAYERADRAYDTRAPPRGPRGRLERARGGPLRDGEREGAARGPRGARAAPALLLRPAPRPVRRATSSGPRPAASHGRFPPARPTRFASRRARSPSSARCSSAAGARRTGAFPA